jgi:DNA-binding response OmpR family regulator
MTKKVLVIDDEQGVTLTVKHGLEGLDKEMDVTVANSGAEAFKQLESQNIPDVILLDIMMPEMNGWEVNNRLRENKQWNKIPVIFITAKTDDFTKTFGSSVSADFIEKPFKIEDLKIRIDEVLEKAKQKYPKLV